MSRLISLTMSALLARGPSAKFFMGGEVRELRKVSSWRITSILGAPGRRSLHPIITRLGLNLRPPRPERGALKKARTRRRSTFRGAEATPTRSTAARAGSSVGRAVTPF